MPKTYRPPKATQQNAKRALEVRAKKPESQRGMTDVGLARARDLSNGRPLTIDTIKRMKAYFDRHEVDKKGETWDDQGKGWQAWQGWGGDEGRSWAERVLSNEPVKKVVLVDMTPEKLKDMPGGELRLAWLRLNQWYNNAAESGHAVEDYINSARWVMAEFENRGFDVGKELPLVVVASRLGKGLIEARFNNLPQEMVVVNDFVNIVGSVAKGCENPNDLDVLIRAETDDNSNMLIKCENAWIQVRNALNPNKEHELQYIFNAQGCHDDYMPMYDLVLRKRSAPETKMVKACGYTMEDFKRGQLFEIDSDQFSDKGPATGVVLDAFDGKIMVEFDEPQTFQLDDIKSHLRLSTSHNNKDLWMVETKKAQPSSGQVHVPTTLTIDEDEVKKELGEPAEGGDPGLGGDPPAKESGQGERVSKMHDDDGCFFCEAEPDKMIMWAGGSKILYVCAAHVGEGVNHTINVNRDKVSEVIDISGQREYNVATPDGINISVSINKQLEGEGDITRESVAAKFWEDNWDNLYPKDGEGKFVYQHHFRGLSEEETKLSDKELLGTSHSLHGDLRFEANGELWGFSAFIGTTAANRDGDKVIAGNGNIRGNFKLAQPKAWLNVGVKKPYISEPGGPGATSQAYAAFHALDTGEYEVGVRNRHFVEIFLKGDKVKGRYTITSVPVEGGRAWVLSRPKDQTPYAESHDLEKEVERLKKEGHKKLIWAKPGEKPKLIDLVEKELAVKFLKAADEDKRLVTGIVLEPDTVDAHSDTISAEEIEKAAFEYMRKSRVIGEQHKKKGEAEIVESYIAPVDFNLGGQKVKKGSWVMTVKVLSDKLWKAVKAGEFTGFSIGGYGNRQAAK